MRAHSLLRPLVLIAAGFSVMGSAIAQTFGNFTFMSDGTSVTITNHANVAVSSIDIPAEINGLPVRTISRLATGVAGSAILRGSVQSITIPEGVTTIGQSAIPNFTALQSITLPNSVTSVGSGAFTGCTALTSVTFGNGVTELNGTFSGCTNLTTVDLPDQVTSLISTFNLCSSLTEIQIPASVTTIQAAFRNCTKLAHVELPSGLTSLGAEAFYNCSGLQDVTFPNGLVSIGDNAFYNCSGLTSLDLPSSLTTIGNSAFWGCTGLASLDFPSSLTQIGDVAFYYCTGLTSLSLPSGLTTIGNSAFNSCTGLTSLVVPDSVTTIGDDAFWLCSALTSVDLPPRYLASLANLGLDYKSDLASSLLVDGIADRLANSPDFISKLADAIIAKSGHYGLSTQADITNVVNQTPQTVRDIIAEVGGESPAVHGITSDLGTLTVKKGKPVAYTVTTTFGATAFAAIGLPAGVVIDPTTGAISGKARKVGTYSVFLHAGVPGGGAVSAVKIIAVTP